MSRVFVAEEVALGRRVVVKVLEPELAQGLSADRFAREVKLAARLQDPRIVPVLAAGSAGDLPYYSMPFVDGETLRARMARAAASREPVPLAECASILRDVALALEYAHGHDVVHRDIKPENVLLSGRTALVADFGVAKALAAAGTGGLQRPGRDSAKDLPTHELTQLGTALGTPAYMAPEQAAGDAVDHRADIYAWGVIAYELLAGRHPFAGRTSAQHLIAAHIAETPAPVASHRPDVPAKLAALVMQSLEKGASARPQSAREVVATIDAVSGWTSGDSPAATTGASGSGRRRWMMIAAAAVVAIGAVGAFLVTRRSATPATTDSALIAVLPFRVTSADASLGYLREGMVDLIAAKLVRSPRTVDQRSVLARWRDAGGGPREDLDRRTAAQLAAELGAGRMIEGDVVGNASQVTINATLVSAPNGEQRGHASARGEAAQLAVLVDSVIAQLLAIDAGENEQRLPSLASTPLAALEAYLAGQASYRSGRYADAANRYAEALQIDSTFAHAGLGLSMASDWTLDPRGPRGRAIATRYADELGLRDRLYLGPTHADSAATSYTQSLARREAGVEAAPDSPDLWYRLGDAQVHYGPAVFGLIESSRRARAAFERGLALDTSYAPLLEHLPLVYADLGDTARARLATVRLMRDTAAYYYPANRVIYATDSASRLAAVRDLDSKPPFLTAYTAIIAVMSDLDLSLFDDALHRARDRAATSADRDFVMQMQYYLAMDRGQPGHAARVALQLPNRLADRMFAATFWDGDSTAGATHYAETKALVSASVPQDANARRSWMTAIFDAAQYELARGDTTHVSRVIARLRALPPVPNAPVESARPERLVMILDAQLAMLASRPDAGQRLASLDSMLALGPIGDHVRLTGNLVASRLWERAGNVRKAYDAAQRWAFTNNPIDGSLHAPYLREQARLAAALGDREVAIAAYRRYLRLRANAEPALARDLATARSELEKLERQSAGR
jgi:tetratricopeptide (TPR) repeat protein/tRNA A-37 threonylcarbamoyl transferase component Bud32